MVLFLDFDGVLHPDPCYDRRRLFEHAPRLEAALAPFPDVDIVLSTTWRNLVGRDELLGYLPSRMRSRVRGVTPIFGSFRAPPALVPFRRQAECMHWLSENDGPHAPWIALDDRTDWFAPYCEQLIECRPAVGFEPAVAARLASSLTRARLHAARTRREARGTELRGARSHPSPAAVQELPTP